MKKRGVSPLVATVILVAIVIIIALLLWFWYNNFLEEQREKAGIDLTQECAQNTELQVRSSSCIDVVDEESYTITIELANTGSSKLTGFLFGVDSTYGSVTKESSRVLDPGTSLQYTISVDYDELLHNEAPVLPNQVEIIPIVSKGSEIKHCNDQSAFTTITCA